MDRVVEPAQDLASANEATETMALRRIAEDMPYAFYFREVTCHFQNGVLRLEGRVGSFYLKQVLQTRLRDLPGVSGIDNRVDVVSSTGLSSVGKPR